MGGFLGALFACDLLMAATSGGTSTRLDFPPAAVAMDGGRIELAAA